MTCAFDGGAARRRARHSSVALAALLSMSRCSRTTAADVATDQPGARAIADFALGERTPAPDLPGARCRDVGARRLCWPGRDASVGRAAKVERTVPLGGNVGGGYRCVGEHSDRRCAPRRLFAGPFRCEGRRCEQRFARLPNDAVWDCVDSLGATICVGGERAAGATAERPIDEGWICSTRSGVSRTRAPAHGADAVSAATEHVCVDLSPDYPEPTEQPWRCDFDVRRGGLTRVCVAGGAATRGDARSATAWPCDNDAQCLRGLVCVDERCVPERVPRANCWFDSDCANSGRCIVGTCVGSP